MTIYEYDVYFRETYIERSFEVRRCEGYVLRGIGYHQILAEWLNTPKLNFHKDGIHKQYYRCKFFHIVLL